MIGLKSGAQASFRQGLGLMHWKTFQSNYLLPLMTMGVIERTIPDKPSSRLQKYRLTEAGKQMVEKME